MRLLVKLSVLCLLLSGISSCKSVFNLVCQPWKIEEVKFNPGTAVLTPEQLRSIEHQLKNDFVFRFHPDSVYVVIKQYDTIYGKWWLNDDKKKIISVVQGTPEQVSEIVKINRKEFLFHPLQDLGSIQYIRCTPATDKK
ncbi:MAG: hypothetical protein KIS94_12195 [Chitinophagales bacterium]|nr:hypothetical protein [Chitinophagales bacterium]